MNLYEMKLGDSVWVSEFESNVLRVPGGWLFRSSDGVRDIYTSSTFVPFDNEFIKTSEQGEPPATDRQRLKPAISLVLSCAERLFAEAGEYDTLERFCNLLAKRAGI